MIRLGNKILGYAFFGVGFFSVGWSIYEFCFDGMRFLDDHFSRSFHLDGSQLVGGALCCLLGIILVEGCIQR